MLEKVEQIVSSVSRELLVIEREDEDQVFVCGLIFDNPSFTDDEIHNEFISDELFNAERALEEAGFIIGDDEINNDNMNSFEVIIPKEELQ